MYKIKKNTYNNTKRGVFNLTNINCSYDCIYQDNGICNYEAVNRKKIGSEKDCIYYEKRK